MSIELVVGIGVALATVALLEPWSRFVHGAVWHGWMWSIHRTHHPSEGRPQQGLEANDGFSLAHAVGAIVAFVVGWSYLEGIALGVVVGVAAGFTLYGTAYFVIHDGLAHGRLPVKFLDRFRALRRIRAAHDVHHKTGGPPFGLFAGPAELKRADRRRRAARKAAAAEGAVAER